MKQVAGSVHGRRHSFVKSSQISLSRIRNIIGVRQYWDLKTDDCLAKIGVIARILTAATLHPSWRRRWPKPHSASCLWGTQPARHAYFSPSVPIASQSLLHGIITHIVVSPCGMHRSKASSTTRGSQSLWIQSSLWSPTTDISLTCSNQSHPTRRGCLRCCIVCPRWLVI